MPNVTANVHLHKGLNNVYLDLFCFLTYNYVSHTHKLRKREQLFREYGYEIILLAK